MPEDEPRVAPDAAPGTDPDASDTEPSEPFPASDGSAAETVTEATEQAVHAGDEWDPAAEEPAVEESYPTGVLEIVTALGGEPEVTAAAVVEADAVPEVGPAIGSQEPVVSEETAPEETEVSPEAAPVEEAGTGEVAEPAGIGTVSEESEAVTAEVEASVEPIVIPAPEVEAAPAPAESVPAARRRLVPWWPFAAYVGLWVVGLGAAAYVLLQVPTGQALYEQLLYGYVVLGGLVLTALGPVLIPVVWLYGRTRLEKEERGGLFARTAFWGALSTLAGVAMWWAMLMVLDSIRLGRPL